MHKAAVGIAALVLMCLAAGAAYADPCQMGRVATLDTAWSDNRATTQISINGQNVNAVIDTGASNSSLFRNAADGLGLHYSLEPDHTAYGFGGAAHIFTTQIHDIAIGDQHATYVHLDVIDASAKGTPPIAMILGQNLLSSEDIEFDLAGGHLNFFRTRGDCSRTALAYWSETWSAIDMQPRLQANDAVIVEAQLNGQTVKALLDTGAYTSIVTLAVARRLGVTPEEDAATRDTVGIGAHRLHSWLATFDTFSMGGESINHPRLRIVDTNVPGADHTDFDMVLGADFFRTHRVMFAYSQQKLYFAYLGGHVFQIVGPVALPGEGAEGQSDPAQTTPQPAPAPH